MYVLKAEKNPKVSENGYAAIFLFHCCFLFVLILWLEQFLFFFNVGF